MILADTSALFALGNADDRFHAEAVASWGRIRDSGAEVVIHTYILAETFALLHRRAGVATALAVSDAVRPVTTVAVDRALHDRAVARIRERPHARNSLVDAVSFVVMEEHGIESAFAFDPDFEREGFRLYGR